MKKSFESYVNISLISSVETNNWSVGRSVFEALCKADERLKPEKAGNSEPLKFVISDLEDCARYWAKLDDVSRGGIEGNADSFMWKRSKKIKSTGHVMHRFRNRSGGVKPTWLIIRAEPDRKVAWSDLFQMLCHVLKPIYATLHIVGVEEQDSKRFAASSVESFGFDDHLTGLPPINLERAGLANLSWMNYFGGELCGRLGVLELARSGFSVKEYEEGATLQVTANLFDVMDDFQAFSLRRAELKSHFRLGTFRVNEEPDISGPAR